ncbi:hypothetical protein OQA88_2055 [Cercophora sp. LCS_1]
MSAKRKSVTNIAKPIIRQSPKVASKSRIDESKATISSGLTPSAASRRRTDPVDEDSSNSPSPSDNEDQSEDDEAVVQKQGKTPLKGKQEEEAADPDTEMASPDQEPEEQGDASDNEPTLGELMRNTAIVDVASSLAAQATPARIGSRSQPLATVNSTSLGTVLNQALKSDDRDLLESCLQVTDVKIIQATINRLDSSLAVSLLSKLADRMHRRPGRAFGLMKWMQWTMIAHGGTLVNEPGLTKKLGNLQSVLEERGRALPKLLALQGKLDMLNSQIQFRKAIKKLDAEGSGDEDDDDVDVPGVVYVEGEEDEDKATGAGRRGAREQAEDEALLISNGFDAETDDDSDEEEIEDSEEVELDVDSMDEDEVDHDDNEDESGDEDEDQEDDDDEDSAPPAKVQKVSKFGKKK